ncbi:hypothetical protein HYY75_11200, partial [bacterium]|nr:hypothetical protein [bacterium]
GAIERQNGYFGVEAKGGIEVKVEQDPNFEATNVDTQELPIWIQSTVQGFLAHAFKFMAPVSPRIVVTKHKEAEVSTAQVDGVTTKTVVTGDGKVLTSMELTVRNNNNQFLLLEGFSSRFTRKLLSVFVNGEPVKPCLNISNDLTYVPLIRSQRIGKQYQPFGISLVFEDSLQRELDETGDFVLELPKLVALDISEMNWFLSVPERYFFIKGPGFFDVGMGNVPPAPGRIIIQGREDKFSHSNVLSQGTIRPRSALPESHEGGFGTAGLLPVQVEIPMLRKVLSFNGKLINHSSSQAPQLKVFFIKEDILNPAFLLFTLFIGLTLSITIFSVFAERTFIAFLGAITILFLEISAQVANNLFSAYLPFLESIIRSLHHGIQMGLCMALVWYFLTRLGSDSNKPIPSKKSA